MVLNGRPTIFSDDLALTICERISLGESLRSITNDENMPSRGTIHNWLLLPEHKDFLDHYEASRVLQADVYADEMDDIAHDETVDTQRARLIIDTRKWVSSKLKPKKYGDRLELENKHSGEVVLSAEQAEQLIRARVGRSDI